MLFWVGAYLKEGQLFDSRILDPGGLWGGLSLLLTRIVLVKRNKPGRKHRVFQLSLESPIMLVKRKRNNPSCSLG